MGAPAKSFRIALGALIIKEKLGTSDRETVEQIRENPYLQYFLGFSEYSDAAPFDATMMVHFRQRLNLAWVGRINEAVVQAAAPPPTSGADDDDEPPASPNQGQLIMDASCTPADIRYPTDLSLLNEAREHSESVIDVLYNQGNCST
jgi:transposase, IS5 family